MLPAQAKLGRVFYAASDDRFFLPHRVVRINVVVQNLNELWHNLVALQRSKQSAIHVYRSLRFLKSSRQRNSKARVLRFPWTIHHTSHHRDLHLLDPGVSLFPDRHLLTQVSLNLLCHLLEERAGCAPAARTCRYLRRETSNAQRLQNLLRHSNFFSTISPRRRSKRNPDRVANTF